MSSALRLRICLALVLICLLLCYSCQRYGITRTTHNGYSLATSENKQVYYLPKKLFKVSVPFRFVYRNYYQFEDVKIIKVPEACSTYCKRNLKLLGTCLDSCYVPDFSRISVTSVITKDTTPYIFDYSQITKAGRQFDLSIETDSETGFITSINAKSESYAAEAFQGTFTVFNSIVNAIGAIMGGAQASTLTDGSRNPCQFMEEDTSVSIGQEVVMQAIYEPASGTIYSITPDAVSMIHTVPGMTYPHLEFSVIQRGSNLTAKKSLETTETVNGLLYREPAVGELKVELKNNQGIGSQTIIKDIVLVPQWGDLRVATVKTGPGKRTVTVEMDKANGGLKKYQIIKEAALKEVLAGTAENINGLSEGINKILENSKTSELDKLKQEYDLLDMKKKIEELKK